MGQQHDKRAIVGFTTSLSSNNTNTNTNNNTIKAEPQQQIQENVPSSPMIQRQPQPQQTIVKEEEEEDEVRVAAGQKWQQEPKQSRIRLGSEDFLLSHAQLSSNKKTLCFNTTTTTTANNNSTEILSLCNGMCLEESFFLELCDPFLGTFFGHIILIIFVTHQSNKLVITNGLGFDVVVSFLTGHPEDLRTLRGEEIV